MGLGRRIFVAGVLAGALAVALVVPAAAGGPAPKVQLAKEPGGPWAEVIKMNVPDGEKKTRYLRVRSKADANQPATFEDAYLTEPGPSYTVKWFKGKTNITADMDDDGYQFTLKPDKDRIFKATIKAPEGAQGICITGAVEVPTSAFGTASMEINGNTCPA